MCFDRSIDREGNASQALREAAQSAACDERHVESRASFFPKKVSRVSFEFFLKLPLFESRDRHVCVVVKKSKRRTCSRRGVFELSRDRHTSRHTICEPPTLLPKFTTRIDQICDAVSSRVEGGDVGRVGTGEVAHLAHVQVHEEDVSQSARLSSLERRPGLLSLSLSLSL